LLQPVIYNAFHNNVQNYAIAVTNPHTRPELPETQPMAGMGKDISKKMSV
jgi:hypothetical protein